MTDVSTLPKIYYEPTYYVHDLTPSVVLASLGFFEISESAPVTSLCEFAKVTIPYTKQYFVTDVYTECRAQGSYGPQSCFGLWVSDSGVFSGNPSMSFMVYGHVV